MSRIVVLTATSVEIPYCLRGLKPGIWHAIDTHEVCVMTTGIGQERVQTAMHHICSKLCPDQIMFLGICSGIGPRLAVGDIVLADLVIYDDRFYELSRHLEDVREKLKRRSLRYKVGGLATSSKPVASVADIGWRVIGVDTESFIVAKEASRAHVPLIIGKAVSGIIPEQKPWLLRWGYLRLACQVGLNYRQAMVKLDLFTRACLQGAA